MAAGSIKLSAKWQAGPEARIRVHGTALIDWMLDDGQWSEERPEENEPLLKGFWERFMKSETPVPEGMVFLPYRSGSEGDPLIYQLAYAAFSGDMTAMLCMTSPGTPCWEKE